MSIEDTHEHHLSAGAAFDPPPARKSILVRLVVYAILLAALGFMVWRIYENQQAAKSQANRQAAALMGRPVPVQVSAVEEKPMPIFLTALGTVTPYMSVTVKARVGGELLPVKFVEGQQVRQGQIIMNVDPRPYQATLDQAKGTLAHDQAMLVDAEAEYRRYKALYEAGVVSKETLDADQATMGQYQGAIESDKAAVENARLQLEWCTIQSPINGKIGLRLVDPGNIITANTTNLVMINQVQPIAVYFTLPENELPQVLQQLAADRRLVADAYDRSDVHKLATGYLLATDNQIDTTTGTAKLKAVFDNQDGALFPNQFVNIHLIMEDRSDALVVPSAAIQSGQQGAFVWVIDTDASGADKARIQLIKVALSEGQVTIVDGGVRTGDKVVVDGADRLRQGQVVEIGARPQRSGQAGGAGQTSGENLFSAPQTGAPPAMRPMGNANRGSDKRKMK